MAQVEFYQVLALYKLAVISEGIYARHLQGKTVGRGFEGLGAQVAQLTERALDIALRAQDPRLRGDTPAEPGLGRESGVEPLAIPHEAELVVTLSSPIPQTQDEIPSSPFFVLRQGMLRGKHVVVYAFSPIHRDPSSQGLRIATAFDAAIPGVRLVTTNALLESFVPGGDVDTTPVLPVNRLSAPEPINPLANRRAVKVIVEQPGIQRIKMASLENVGIPNANGAKLHLFHDNTEVPLHVLDLNGNGTLALDLRDEFRFYAPGPNDRWNRSDVYWLVVGDDRSHLDGYKRRRTGQCSLAQHGVGTWDLGSE